MIFKPFIILISLPWNLCSSYNYPFKRTQLGTISLGHVRRESNDTHPLFCGKTATSHSNSQKAYHLLTCVMLRSHTATMRYSYCCSLTLVCEVTFRLSDMPYRFNFQDTAFHKASPLKLILGHYLVLLSPTSSFAYSYSSSLLAEIVLRGSVNVRSHTSLGDPTIVSVSGIYLLI